MISTSKSGLEGCNKTLVIKPDLAVDNEFATYIPGSYNEKIPLLYEIIMDVFHHSMLCEDTRLFHDDMKQLWHAFFESPDSMALLRNKCAEMKSIYFKSVRAYS